MANTPCGNVHNFPNSNLQCAFIKSNPDCQDEEGLVNYLNFVYCDFENTLLPVILCSAWVLLLFLTIGSTADDFFCPALDTIAKFLKLSHNVAGVTFLAFGNGAPDIFSSLAGINQMRPKLVIGALFGAGLFVTCVVAGSIILVAPFDMMQRPFLRDVIFYLAAVFWTFYLFYVGEITIFHSVGFILLYIFYLIVVLLGHFIYQRWLKPNAVTQALVSNSAIIITVASPTGNIICQNIDDDIPESEPYFWRRRSFERQHSNRSSLSQRSYSDCSINSINSDAYTDTNTLDVKNKENAEHSPLLGNSTEVNENTPLLGNDSAIAIEYQQTTEWQRFLRTVNPIDLALWTEFRHWQKILRILSFPLVLLLKLTIPVVDHDKPDSNWCQSLVMVNCFVSPVFFSFWLGFGWVTWSVFPVWGLMLIIGFVLAIITFLTTRRNKPPVHHVMFAFVGFVTSVIWIYCIANEIVRILKTIGIVMKLSDTILGLTVLAWGNSLGDLIADISLARQNLPRMGMSGCFGGPLFNLLLGIGIPFTIISVRYPGTSIHVDYLPATTILSAFLGLSLISSLVCIPLMKFHTKRIYGVYLISIYFIFLILSILNEIEVL